MGELYCTHERQSYLGATLPCPHFGCIAAVGGDAYRLAIRVPDGAGSDGYARNIVCVDFARNAVCDAWIVQPCIAGEMNAELTTLLTENGLAGALVWPKREPERERIIWQGSVDGETWCELPQGRAMDYPHSRAFDNGKLYLQFERDGMGHLKQVRPTIDPEEKVAPLTPDPILALELEEARHRSEMEAVRRSHKIDIDLLVKAGDRIADLQAKVAAAERTSEDRRCFARDVNMKLAQASLDVERQAAEIRRLNALLRSGIAVGPAVRPDAWRPSVDDFDLLPDA